MPRMPAPSFPIDAVRADAARLADCAFTVVRQAYPHKLDHLILDADDHPLPQQIHPVFWGCYDWHSSVHMHWSLLRLLKIAPDLPQHSAIAAHFDTHFTDDKVARERAYAAVPARRSFERPYGWAWLLKLQSELDAQPRAARWAAALRPFSKEVAQRFAMFLAQGHYPVRAGTHANSAFAMLLGREYALQEDDDTLSQAIDAAAQRWFGGDRRYPSQYEPSGADFLSPGLCEAVLMRRVLGADFAAWWSAFAPSDAALAAWLEPARVANRMDAQGVHLDGLNLSRAWCLRALAGATPPAHEAAFARAADAHWSAAWPHVTGGDFVATHWLVSFALLAAEASTRHA